MKAWVSRFDPPPTQQASLDSCRRKSRIEGKHGGLGPECHHCSVFSDLAARTTYTHPAIRRRMKMPKPSAWMQHQRSDKDKLALAVSVLTSSSWGWTLCAWVCVFSLAPVATQGSLYMCLLLHFLFLWGRHSSSRTWQLTTGDQMGPVVRERVCSCTNGTEMLFTQNGLGRTSCWLMPDSTH